MDKIDFKKLSEPFAPEDIEWRAGATNQAKTKALALAYITSRAVMNRLDEVCGPEDWQDDFRAGPDGGVLAGIGIRVNGEWIWKWDGAENSNIEAVKGGLSDAFKRAAVKWGIGRYLYSLDGVWVECEQRGNTVVLKGKPTLPNWALPGKPATQQKQAAKPAQPAEEQPAVKPAKMDIETAKAITNSAGERYGNLSNDTLSNMTIGIGKALRKQDLTPEDRAEYQLKLDAIGVILKARAEITTGGVQLEA